MDTQSMPSQQPTQPHILSTTPKTGIDRDRDLDSIGPSAPHEWILSPPSTTTTAGPISAISTSPNTIASSPTSTTTTTTAGTMNAASSPRTQRRASSTTMAASPASLGPLPPALVTLSCSFSSASLQDTTGTSAGGFGPSSSPTLSPAPFSRTSTSRSLETIERRHDTLTRHSDSPPSDQLAATTDGPAGSNNTSYLPHQQTQPHTQPYTQQYQSQQHYHNFQQHTHTHSHPSTPRPSSAIKSPLLESSEPRHRQRTHSSQSRSKLHTPSVQLALADPTLSKSLSSSPAPSRIGSEQDRQVQAKRYFERNVRRYYYQLTVGCQLSACTNKLCRSCNLAPKMTKDAAAILSIQLAARPRLFFCSNCPQDPAIQVPDSPIPTTPLANGRPPSLQALRGHSSNTATTRIAHSTCSSKSSPGPAASVEDFRHSKNRPLYDPNEYSKSVPSFTTARLIAPARGARRRPTQQHQGLPVATKHIHSPLMAQNNQESPTGKPNKELPVTKEEHPYTASPPSSEEQTGTPLFKSLLSLSPFSHMFSSASSNTPSKSQELNMRRLPPSHQFKKAFSTGDMSESGRPSRRHLVAASTVTGPPRGLDGFHSVIHARSFSPTRSTSPPESPISPPASLPDITRIHSTARTEDTSFGVRLHQQTGSTGSVVYHGDESVGLGYINRPLNSQRVLDLSRYYDAPSPSPISAGSATLASFRKSRRRHRDVDQGRDIGPTPRPMFGTFRDPDSDGSVSSWSTEEEPNKTGDSPWRGSSFHHHHHHHHHHRSFSHQHRSFSSGSAALSTVSPPQSPLEKELDSRTLYAFARTRLRRDSASSTSSEGEPVASLPWSSLPPIPSSSSTLSMRRSSSSSSISSTASSRRSSMDESEVMEVALPYLNLTLLRQAIETYNASKPDTPPRSPPSLTLRDFKPIHPVSWGLSLDRREILDNSAPVALGAGHTADVATHGPPSHNDFTLADATDQNTELFGNAAMAQEVHNNVKKKNLMPTLSDYVVPTQDIPTRVKETDRTPNVVSPARSSVSSGLCSSEGDSTFLLDSLRSVFSSSTALGSSFLMRDREERSGLGREASGGVNVGGIDLEALRECYEMMIELKPRTIFAIQVTNSIEILLARMELEMELELGQTMGRKVWSEEEMRAIIILLMNPFLFEQPYQESLLRRILLIFIALPDKAKLIQWLSCMDDEGMAQMVTLFKTYLSAHFTPRPLGDSHPAICAVMGLSILYQANNIGTKREQERRRRSVIQGTKEGKAQIGSMETSSTISFKYFYSGVMEALKFKDEYQIWRDGWGKSPHEKQFSYFDYPFLLSPTSKSHIMNLDALTQMSAHYEDACVRHALADHAQRLLPDSMTASAHEFQKGIRAASSPYLVLELTRGRLVEEAFEQITKKHADLKKPLKVAFVDVGEEGMDQGGVTKEFFQIMVEKVFDSQFGLFKELEESHSWWFEGMMDGSSHVEMSSKDARVRLVEYELVGILVGLALYNGVILGVRFPSVVYRKLLGWDVELDSFIESFPALGNGLEQMLTWTDGDVYDVFMREFEISYEHLGQVTTIPLIPGGQDVPVTNDNREHYVKAYMNHYLHEHIRQEFAAFQRGFEKICGGEALKLLRPEELELLLCGNADLDMHELETSCLYDDGYSPNHTLIKEFWEIVHEDLSPEQHKQLLVFVTGSDRIPIRGLKDLMFVIQRNGPDSDRLPTALTCFSRLLLPEYANKGKMKERLVTAIENSNGFGLV